MKDDSGSYAVFKEQESSASLMTAARLHGCEGQACDAVSTYTKVKMEDAPTLLKLARSKSPDIWIRFPRRKWPKTWQSIQELVVPLEMNFFVDTSLLDCLKMDGESTNLGMLVCASSEGAIPVRVRG